MAIPRKELRKSNATISSTFKHVRFKLVRFKLHRNQVNLRVTDACCECNRRGAILSDLNFMHLESNEFEPNAFKGRADRSTNFKCQIQFIGSSSAIWHLEFGIAMEFLIQKFALWIAMAIPWAKVWNRSLGPIRPQIKKVTKCHSFGEIRRST